MKFKFKRLMFLGASPYQLPAIKKAKELGCIVITVSKDLTEIGHCYSDLSLKLSTIEKQKVLEAAIEYKIDAIMTYAANAAVETVSFVAEKLQLPGNPIEAAIVLQDKGKFRNMQKRIGLPYPEFIVYNEDSNVKDIYDLLEKTGEIIIKPVDSGGSRGQSIIDCQDKLNKALKYAIDNSMSKEIIIEKKLNKTMLELDGDVFFQNGKIAFSYYGHNYFKKNSKFNVPVGEIFPGVFNEEVERNLDEQFQSIITELNLNSGCINFDGFKVGEDIYIIDIALRNGGIFVPNMIQLSSGFDMTEASIYSAFGECYLVKKEYSRKPIVSYILNSYQEGLFNGYEVKSEYIDKIVFEHQIAEVGDEVNEFSIGDNTLGVVAFEFNDLNEAVDFINTVEDIVTVVVDSKKRAKGTSGFRVSPFVQNKLKHAENNSDSTVQRVLKNQFYINTTPDQRRNEKSMLKHYEASSLFEFENKRLLGLERLYRRVLIIEPMLQCLANCRHCLRQFYSPFALSQDDLNRIARSISKLPELEDVRELLITGGDPLLVPSKIIRFLDELERHPHNIKIVRIASRIPIHQPSAINDNILSLFKRKYSFQIEMATQINHSVELFPEVKEAFLKIREYVNIYNQTVLLKDVNNSVEELINVCDEMRYLGIENHYLFHCVPIKGSEHFRTTIDESLSLVKQLTTSGYLSGRAKPQLALMTDIGKITLYEKSIIKREDSRILLQTSYRYDDRIKWNPYWELPESTIVDKDGFMQVWYYDKRS